MTSTQDSARRNLGGRPAVGPPIQVRLPGDLLKRVDQAAGKAGVNRAEMVRRLIAKGLARA